MLPTLSALLLVIASLAVLSHRLLSSHLVQATESAALKTAELIARDQALQTALQSILGPDLRPRLLEALANDDLILAIAVYSAADDHGRHLLVQEVCSGDDYDSLLPASLGSSLQEIGMVAEHDREMLGFGAVQASTPILVDREIQAGRTGDPPAEPNLQPSPQSSLSEPLGVIRVAYSMADMEAKASQHQFLILIMAVLLLLVSGLGADRLAKYMLRSVHQLHAALREATDGDLKARLPEGGRDELGMIAQRFNMMVECLDANREEIRDHNRSLGKRVEERTTELKRAYKELQTLDKAKDTFLSNISHEMRTPLTSIVAATEILSEFTGNDENARQEFLAIIHRESARLMRLISSILETAKMEAETPTLFPEFCDLGIITSQVMERFQPQALSKQITLKLRKATRELALNCDVKLVSKVISALLENAINFGPNGSQVTLDLQTEGGTASLEVRDAGPGVPTDKRGLLFTVFGQVGECLTDKPRGLGMSLAISKRIAEGHGGDLVYVEEDGPGACFRFTLPQKLAHKAAKDAIEV
ncbi:MAG: sensor histidine kinase [Planctomycetota bacterium]